MILQREHLQESLCSILCSEDLHAICRNDFKWLLSSDWRGCPKAAVDAARAMGIDLIMHRSRAITEEIIHQADVIFSFDEEDHKTLTTRFPFAKKKLHRLGILAKRGESLLLIPMVGTLQVSKQPISLLLGLSIQHIRRTTRSSTQRILDRV